MKLTGWLVILCIAAPLSGMAGRAQIPSILETTGDWPGGPTRWISAAAVADEEKIIDLDLIQGETLRTIIEDQRRDLGDRLPAKKSKAGEKPSIATIPLSECKYSTYVEADRGGMASNSTLSALAANSKSIVRGTIRTIDLGFAFGAPSSLLGVEISEVIKGPSPKSLFYIDYPVARFRIGPFHFCNSTQGFEPRPGDEVLLFDYVGPVDQNDVLYAPRLDQLFFQSQSGSLVLPPSLKNTPGLETVRALDDIVGRLRSAAGIIAAVGFTDSGIQTEIGYGSGCPGAVGGAKTERPRLTAP